MTKTALDYDDEKPDPIPGMTSEDIARYLLDGLVVDTPKNLVEMDLRLKLAGAYIELAKAYIIADAIRDAALTLTDGKAPNND